MAFPDLIGGVLFILEKKPKYLKITLSNFEMLYTDVVS